jgi:hypothetical protein
VSDWRRARGYDLGTLSLSISLMAGALALLLLVFGSWVESGAITANDTVLEPFVEGKGGVLLFILMVIPLTVVGLLATGVAFWLGILGMLRRGSHRLRALVGTLISATVFPLTVFAWM